MKKAKVKAPSPVITENWKMSPTDTAFCLSGYYGIPSIMYVMI